MISNPPGRRASGVCTMRATALRPPHGGRHTAARLHACSSPPRRSRRRDGAWTGVAVGGIGQPRSWPGVGALHSGARRARCIPTRVAFAGDQQSRGRRATRRAGEGPGDRAAATPGAAGAATSIPATPPVTPGEGDDRDRGDEARPTGRQSAGTLSPRPIPTPSRRPRRRSTANASAGSGPCWPSIPSDVRSRHSCGQTAGRTHRMEETASAPVPRRDIVGGLIHEYYREAA
jgi:hypothetical protein